MMGWNSGGGMGSLGWLGMGVFWLILLGLIVWLVIRLLPGSSEPPTRTPGESAVEILDRRMANAGRRGLQRRRLRRGWPRKPIVRRATGWGRRSRETAATIRGSRR